MTKQKRVLTHALKPLNISVIYGTAEAVQFIQGGFSHRLKKDFGYLGEVWQRGFSELRVEDRESYVRHREYIAQNPVRKGLVDSPGKFPYCFTYLAERKVAGAKERV